MNIKHTIFTGKRFIRLESTPSTNVYAHQLLTKTNPIDGTVIFADDQTRGKGQPGNLWYSEKGKSLTFSIIYKTGFLRAMDQAYINFGVSVGILNALARFVVESENLSLKWPNDVFFKNQKLGGILIENIIKGVYLEHTIVGIGMNVGSMSFPEEINALSIEDISSHKVPVLDVCQAICEEVEKNFLKLRKGSVEIKELKNAYESRLWGNGKKTHFLLKDGNPLEAVITGVDAYGRLVLDKNGELTFYDNKELSLVLS